MSSSCVQNEHMEGTVYLVHLDQPIGNPDNPRAMAQHYIGWALDHVEREHVHRTGNGSKMLKWCVANGVGFKIVRTWDKVDRHFERKLKNRKNAKQLCPVCCEQASMVA